MTRVLVVSAVLLAPMLAAAQPLPAQYVGPEGEAMPPGAFVSPPPGGGPFSNSPFSSAPFDNAPFQSEAVPRRPSRPRAECVFAGQGYSEGAVVQAQGGEQRVCAVRPGATRDEEGNLPLSWQRTGG